MTADTGGAAAVHTSGVWQAQAPTGAACPSTLQGLQVQDAGHADVIQRFTPE